ncbi:hypothetical protein [Thermocatellispora tengchongensis]|uniref:hypothetical protein n=1 Tax=Thermocatellispora tengchongensis TaxID=1073253 RepID=UPI00363B2F33
MGGAGDDVQADRDSGAFEAAAQGGDAVDAGGAGGVGALDPQVVAGVTVISQVSVSSAPTIIWTATSRMAGRSGSAPRRAAMSRVPAHQGQRGSSRVTRPGAPMETARRRRGCR